MISKIIQTAYHLPWSETNNPNGWIEPTTFCQLQCAGCYRNCNREDSIAEHVPLTTLKKQVDWFITNRNVQTISIAGGEPLMYPQLDELIEYISSKKCRTMIYTNGLLVTSERLQLLHKSGATQIMIHIDEHQNRPDITSNNEISNLREYYCEMFRHQKGILLGFIQPISNQNVSSVQEILSMTEKNNDVVSLIVFTIYRDICKTQSNPSIPTKLEVENLIKEINKKSEFIPAAYLTSSKDKNDISWLFGTRIGLQSKIISSFSPQLYKKLHERYNQKHGRFLFISSTNIVSFFMLLMLVSYSSIRKVLWAYLFKNRNYKSKKLFIQTILLLRGIEEKNGTWDECEGCPDRIIYNGKLVPSCILENLKNADITAYSNVNI